MWSLFYGGKFMKNKFISFVLSILCISSTFSYNLISAVSNELIDEGSIETADCSEYGLGCIIDEDISENFETNVNTNSVSQNAVDSFLFLPNSADLSTDSAFPPIGNQGSVESCVAWATTYYTYTYMVHNKKGISSTENNSYSPKWTYNLTNGGIDQGCYIDDAFDVLINQGALTTAECPYYTSSGLYTLEWSDNTQAMIDALSTRAVSQNYTYVNRTYNSDFESQINDIKSGIVNKRPYVVALKALRLLSNSTLKTCADSNHDGQKIYVRNAGTYSSGAAIRSGHAMTIVGYDDSVWCDVNGNGIVDTGETGAFKVANSWGDTWSNSGYTWILYDALLSTSRIKSSSNSSLTWDSSYLSTRIPFFGSSEYSSNVFYFLDDVQDYTVGFVSEITLSTSRRNQLLANSRSNSRYTTLDNTQIYQKFDQNTAIGRTENTPISFSGTIVLNHVDSENIFSHLSGYSWGARIIDTYSDDYSVNISYYKLVDNLGNIISSSYSGNSVNGTYSDCTKSINLSRGDVDYSGSVNESDVNMIIDYLVHLRNFSNVQIELADYNNDGRVDITDVSSLRTRLSSLGYDVSSIDRKLNSYISRGLINMEVD